MTGRCPSPGKRAYATRQQAQSACDLLRRDPEKMLAMRPYRCACGRFHLTSQTSERATRAHRGVRSQGRRKARQPRRDE